MPTEKLEPKKSPYWTRITELHDAAFEAENENKLVEAVAGFRELLHLVSQSGDGLNVAHCRWHYASVLIAMGKLRAGVAQLLTLLKESRQLDNEPDHIAL